MSQQFNWQLINDSITKEDKKVLTDFINTDGVRFTNGKKVKEFEKKWSEWVGCKHSVYVNSGASANYIMASIMKEIHGTGEVIVPPLGWVSDIAPLVNLGFTPVFVDVDMKNMSITYQNIKNAITHKTVGITLVHLLGFNAITNDLVKLAKDKELFLIEDCCEAHGATYRGKRVGNFGDVSNFSFYFGHHITSIEGGMVCTNSDVLLDYIKLYRSHGMTREASPELQNNYKNHFPDVNPLFTFAVPGYNMRNQELNAVLGLSQMDRLDYNIECRRENLEIWLDTLDSDKFITNFYREGNSNFALPLILIKKDLEYFQKVCKLLEQQGVEYRIGTAGGGNQARQPYLNDYHFRIDDNLDNTNHIHDFGLYVGNHPELIKQQIIDLCRRLNEIN